MAREYIDELGDGTINPETSGVDSQATDNGTHVKTLAPIYYTPATIANDGKATRETPVTIKSALEGKSNKNDGVYYVVGTYDYSAYSETATYTATTSSGPFTSANSCVYGGKAYFCKTTISTPEAWNSDHWTAIPTPVLTGTIDGVTELYAGLKIAYKFSITGGSSSTYLNINNLGNKYIRRNDGNLTTHIPYNSAAFLVFDGTYWRWADFDSDNVYSIHAACGTAANTAAKTATAYGYVLTAGETFLIRFSYANTYAGKLNLNVNSQGAKDIWINGSVSSASNYNIPAGIWWCHYDGTVYHIWTDGSVMYKELRLTTKLADDYIASATTWNAKQNALTINDSKPITIGTAAASNTVTGQAHTHDGITSIARASVTNIDISNPGTEPARMTLSQVTSATTQGTDPGDGYVLNLLWDNAGNWDTQIYVPNAKKADKDYGHLKVRYKNESSTWGDWEYLPGAFMGALLDANSDLDSLYQGNMGEVIQYYWKYTSKPICTSGLNKPGMIADKGLPTGTGSANLYAFHQSSTRTSEGIIVQVMICEDVGIYYRHRRGSTTGENWSQWTKVLLASDITTNTSTKNGKITIAGNDLTVYVHPTSSGNKHVPSGGSSNQVLKWSSDGTAAWNDITYSMIPVGNKYDVLFNIETDYTPIKILEVTQTCGSDIDSVAAELVVYQRGSSGSQENAESYRVFVAWKRRESKTSAAATVKVIGTSMPGTWTAIVKNNTVPPVDNTADTTLSLYFTPGISYRTYYMHLVSCGKRGNFNPCAGNITMSSSVREAIPTPTYDRSTINDPTGNAVMLGETKILQLVSTSDITTDTTNKNGKITVAGTDKTVYVHPAGSAASVTGVPTANATPAFGGTFKVNQITTDATSHVSAVTERTITIPNTTGNASTAGLTKLYTGTGTNTDGTMTQSAIKTALDGKADLENISQAVLSEPSQSDDTKYLIVSQTTFGGSSTTAYGNHDLSIIIQSRHSGTGLAVIQCNVNTNTPTETSLTGTINIFTTTTARRISSPLMMYRKYDANTYKWTVTVVVKCSDYNNFKIKSILSRNGFNYSTSCEYVTDLTTLGTQIASAVTASNSDHTHGNITNGGALQTSDVTIANGDKLVITDASDSNKVARASAAFDGTTTTKALTQKGTFESFAKSGDITTAIQALYVSSEGGAGKYISAISETDGLISATATTMDTEPTANSTNAVTSGGIKTALNAKMSSTVSEDASNELQVVGVQSSATSTLKRDSGVTVQNGNVKATTYKFGTNASMTYNSTTEAIDFSFT